VKISTTRFGELELEDAKVIDMPDGMVGFSERRFVILNPENGGPFCWYQSVENPALSFVVVDPAGFYPEYKVKLTREEYDRLQLEPGAEMVVMCVVIMSPDPHRITINLLGPIVLNPTTMIARQVVMEGDHTTRHLLFAPREPAVVAKVQKAQPVLTLSLSPTIYSNLGFAHACT
jgi:flagellar assembly factor FliW